jgi:uncharacterized DUF497 family protein
MNIPKKLGIPEYEFRLIFGTTKIEYDETKEDKNRVNHSYSLESAVYLLNNLVSPLGPKKPHLTKGPFFEKGEFRHMHMSLDDSDNVVIMVTTMRNEETVRVLSFRRASSEEIEEFIALTHL